MLVLASAVDDYRAAAGGDAAVLLRELLQGHVGGAEGGVEWARRHFQKAAYDRIVARRRPIAEDRMRDRLLRWNLPGAPLRVDRRVLRRLEALRGLVPPRVSAAALSTLWNRWCTCRHFQRRGLCVLGCPSAEDSIEHYGRCPIIRQFASSFLHLRMDHACGLAYVLFAAPELDEPLILTRCAVLVYAAWRTTESVRRRRGPASVEDCRRALQQAAREAVRGHPVAARALEYAG